MKIKKKKSIALIVALVLTMAFPVTSMAGIGQKTVSYGGKKITVSCSGSSSWHQVTPGSYPRALGTLFYYSGTSYKYKNTSGVSYSGYWYGSIKVTSGYTKTGGATTNYNGYIVNV